MAGFEKYTSQLGYTYAPGVFPSMEAMKACPGRVRALLTHPSGEKSAGVSELIERCKRGNIYIESAPRLIERIARKENCHAMAVVNKLATPLDAASDHLVLVNPGDAGNVGTILRTALGFGIRNIAIIGQGVDGYDPRVVRSSMGAVFWHNIQTFCEFSDYAASFAAHTHYFFRLKNAQALQQAAHAPKRPFALIFGNESSGLPLQLQDVPFGVVIAHSPAIDSLNVAVAAGIALNAFYHTTDRKSTRLNSSH